MNPVIAGLVLILEALFAVGVIGSAVVILLTMVEVARVMFEKEPPLGAPSQKIDRGVGEA